MLDDPLFIVAAVAVLGVLVILMIGIGGFARGGDFNRKHANRIMRYRIYAQAAAIALILLYVALRRYMGP
ncbi:MAG: twin transmembrane helix small protein [Rhodobacter sp.]|nr:twin transmembrane helix small protein [Rhodobacter sp.]MCA3487949.1 twin transmembrane helix small protein [Rhodobacter sp.]MCA3494866.1 twin transmembrane helix small protein [Rhodobacter sp.]MCA3499835.1 twin transmembrane helix small protein [Rhodobacter sp.]MCA3503848.1 twin transmembrane helix small protein [Rhodobacter sp.]